MRTKLVKLFSLVRDGEYLAGKIGTLQFKEPEGPGLLGIPAILLLKGCVTFPNALFLMIDNLIFSFFIPLLGLLLFPGQEDGFFGLPASSSWNLSPWYTRN